MSSPGARVPRKGDKSKATVRSDAENAIRKEYREAGVIDGLARAWVLCQRCAVRVLKERGGNAALSVSDGCDEAASDIACELLSRFPKRGRTELAFAGASEEYIAETLAIIASRASAERARVERENTYQNGDE